MLSFLFVVSWLSILILLAYMAMVIVILLNILIAQMSYTYSEAKKTAKLQYAIDTMFIVTRLEYSRFVKWVSTRGCSGESRGGSLRGASPTPPLSPL